jgi:sulfhydrogenase subunit beta (sulfur reductase)
MKSLRTINRTQLVGWVQQLSAEQSVYAPQAVGDQFAFRRLETADALRLDYDVTILPPKKYFQPQQETLVRFTREGEFQSVLPQERFVLFGVHPYDFEAIAQMDLIFGRDPVDAHYQRRRENASIVVVDVERASEHVFAACLGHATARRMSGFDLMLTKIGEDRYLVDARGAKGAELTRALDGAPEADASDLAAREQVWQRNERELCRHELKPKPEALPQLLEQAREHPIWQQKADLCFSCGSCTLVCPTCYCFDVDDKMNWDLRSGHRLRRWDGCLLTRFAAVAGDHNFRRRRAQRYRHRYYRKGKYLHDMIGRVGCVGCGRCTQACTAKIADPVEIYNTLAESQ